MSPVEEVCVDASLAVKVVVTEPGSDKADALFNQWANEGKQLRAYPNRPDCLKVI
jgi:predicted nucleic acid-binding protein